MPANPQVTDEMVEKARQAIVDQGHWWLALDVVRAALTAALADHVVGWRTMDSAPKDGTNILLRSEHQYGTKTPAACSWWSEQRCAANDGGEPEDYQEGWYYVEDSDDLFRRPTHWMPLPAAPLPQKEG